MSQWLPTQTQEELELSATHTAGKPLKELNLNAQSLWTMEKSLEHQRSRILFYESFQDIMSDLSVLT